MMSECVTRIHMPPDSTGGRYEPFGATLAAWFRLTCSQAELQSGYDAETSRHAE